MRQKPPFVDTYFLHRSVVYNISNYAVYIGESSKKPIWYNDSYGIRRSYPNIPLEAFALELKLLYQKRAKHA